jgi:hypothetical protein
MGEKKAIRRLLFKLYICSSRNPRPSKTTHPASNHLTLLHLESMYEYMSMHLMYEYLHIFYPPHLHRRFPPKTGRTSTARQLAYATLHVVSFPPCQRKHLIKSPSYKFATNYYDHRLLPSPFSRLEAFSQKRGREWPPASLSETDKWPHPFPNPEQR